MSVPTCLSSHNLIPFSVATKSGSTVVGYGRGLSRDDDSGKPIFVLLHGYPQTNYIWRHIIKLMPSDTRLFVPDLPGYGNSTPVPSTAPEANSKLSIGLTLLEALSALVTASSTSIILLAHDRGARIAHHLSVSSSISNTLVHPFTLLATILLDIVPVHTMWRDGKITSSDPNSMVSNFHWPFLANAELATEFITLIGGDIFVERMIRRWMGKGATSVSNLEADDGMSVYCTSFKKESVIRASCDDYAAGATVDMARELEDMERDRKIRCPVLAMHSAGLGRMWEVEGAWKKRVEEPERNLRVVQASEGVGHFVGEEGPEETWGVVRGWLEEMRIEI